MRLTSSRAAALLNPRGSNVDDADAWTTLTVSCDTSFVLESIQLPRLEQKTVIVQRRAIYDALRSAVPPQASEALEAGDVAGAVAAVGCAAVSSEEGLVAAVTTRLSNNIRRLEIQRQLLEVNDDDSSLPNGNREREREASYQSISDKIRDAQQKINTIRRRVRESENLCPITMEEIQTSATTPCCQNTFEWEALLRAIHVNFTCPMCRHKPLLPAELVVMNASRDPDDAAASKRERLTTITARGTEDRPYPDIYEALHAELLAVFEQQPDAKVLVFSAHEMSVGFQGGRTIADTVEEVVGSSDAYRVLKGTGTTIQKILQCFKDGKPYVPATASAAGPNGCRGNESNNRLKVLLLNAMHLGAGLNIESATHVITLHGMSTEMYNQVIGRAQRVGRNHPLKVIDIRMSGNPVHSPSSASSSSSSSSRRQSSHANADTMMDLDA